MCKREFVVCIKINVIYIKVHGAEWMDYLTQLCSGLLQFADLVLDEEHGQRKEHQSQELKLGRHHDPQEPH